MLLARAFRPFALGIQAKLAMPITLHLVTALLAPAQAELYKCTDASGGVSYQQTACSGAARGDAMQLPDRLHGQKPSASRAQPGAEHWSVEQQLKRMQAISGAESQTLTKPAAASRGNEPPARPRRVQILNAIRRRQVIPGMTPKEVSDALGPPTASKRDGGGVRSWSYRGVDAEGKRRSQTVYFRDNQVTGVSFSGARVPRRFDPDQDRWLE